MAALDLGDPFGGDGDHLASPPLQGGGRGVEIEPRRQIARGHVDRSQHLLDVQRNVRIAEAQDLEPLCASAASRITSASPRCVRPSTSITSPIAGQKKSTINGVDHRLPAKLEAEPRRAQPAPQHHFGHGRVVAQTRCQRAQPRIEPRHRLPSPSGEGRETAQPARGWGVATGDARKTRLRPRSPPPAPPLKGRGGRDAMRSEGQDIIELPALREANSAVSSLKVSDAARRCEPSVMSLIVITPPSSSSSPISNPYRAPACRTVQGASSNSHAMLARRQSGISKALEDSAAASAATSSE